MENKHVNKFDILEKIKPLVENTAMRFNLIPIEIDFSKESGKWFLRIFLFSHDHDVLFQGKKINLKIKRPIDGIDTKHFICRIVDFDETNGLTVETEDGITLLIPKDNILRAQLEIE